MAHGSNGDGSRRKDQNSIGCKAPPSGARCVGAVLEVLGTHEHWRSRECSEKQNKSCQANLHIILLLVVVGPVGFHQPDGSVATRGARTGSSSQSPASLLLRFN